MKSKVYFTSEISLASIEKIAAMPEFVQTFRPRNFAALKIHFGEENNRGYIRPEFVRPLVNKIKEIGAYPFLTDTNTIYIGKRADAYHHLLVAAEHGFSLENCGCPIIIADGLRGNAAVEVNINKKHFARVLIANSLYAADSLLVLTHFKGHEISGFGGAIKNIGMGAGTRAGKYAMHDKLHPNLNLEKCSGCGECIKWCSGRALTLVNKVIHLNPEKCNGCGECILSCPQKVFVIPWDDSTKNVQEKMVEYAYGALQNKPAFFINFLNHLTKFCDCYATKEPPLLADIGIVWGQDIVAVDRASIDLVNKKFGQDFARYNWPEIDWQVQLDYAQQLGLGSQEYQLIEL